MRFRWDPGKVAANLRKHGVSFDVARSVFFDDFAIQFQHDRECRSPYPYRPGRASGADSAAVRRHTGAMPLAGAADRAVQPRAAAANGVDRGLYAAPRDPLGSGDLAWSHTSDCPSGRSTADLRRNAHPSQRACRNAHVATRIAPRMR
jgi:hypothetical protein